MSKEEKGGTKRIKGGYQPLTEGYQPQEEKKGYQPSGSEEPAPPQPPAGGTGESSGNKE
jgi:hypothetical protein